VVVCRAIRRAHHGSHDRVQKEWFYHRLCTIWLYDFNAPSLSFSRPTGGGPAFGPLISFILAAAELVMAKRPTPDNVADAVVRERKEREYARQLSFFFARERQQGRRWPPSAPG